MRTKYEKEFAAGVTEVSVVSFKMPLYVLVFYEQLSTILESLKVKYLKTGFNPFYSPK